jgi:hypothetical protein
MREITPPFSPLWLALLNAVLMVLLWQAGFRRTRRVAESERPARVRHAGALVQWVLGLLGLLQAFSFGTVYSKYESRRMSTTIEATAISTFSTRTELLPAEPRRIAREALVRYVGLHQEIAAPGLSFRERLHIDTEIHRLQDELKALVLAHVKTPAGAPYTVALVPPMDVMFDQYEARFAGFAAHVPFAVAALLLFVAMLAAHVIGRAEGLAQPRPPRETLLFVALVSAVTYTILDLDRPLTGLSRVSELPMQRLRERLMQE